MENNNRPSGRKRNVTGKADPIKKKGQGLGTGPVGSSKPGSFAPKTEAIHETRPSASGRSVKRGGGALSIIAIAALLLFGDIDESLVAEDAMIREFIGGGIYE